MNNVIFKLLSAGRCLANCIEQGLNHRNSEVGCKTFAIHCSENNLDIRMVVWEIGGMASTLFSELP